MKKTQINFVIFVCLILTGCTAALEESGFLMPRPTQSEYFLSEIAGFVIDTKQLPIDIRYNVGLKKIKPIPEGAFVGIDFENPLDKNQPIHIEQGVNSEEGLLYFQSPKVSGLKSYQGYYIEVTLYESSNKINVLGFHRQVIRSHFDQNRLNKELAKNNRESE